MVTEQELVARVDEAFASTGHALTGWADPHPDRSPSDEEYSQLSDPTKWRIVGDRADSWLLALVETGLAVVDHSAHVHWRMAPRTILSRVGRVTPYVLGALPLIVARSQLGTVDDAGVTLGTGDPAVPVAWIPECGCDACDSGSQDVLDELDEYILGVVSGRFRRLWSGDREITVVGGERWNASGEFGRGEVRAILVDPAGWLELSGRSWMADR